MLCKFVFIVCLLLTVCNGCAVAVLEFVANRKLINLTATVTNYFKENSIPSSRYEYIIRNEYICEIIT